MRYGYLLILFGLLAFGGRTQDIAGSWYGLLEVGGSRLPLVFHLVRTDSGYTGTLDSPDQGAAGIPLTRVSFDSGRVRLSQAALGLAYEGRLTADSLTGTFSQRGLRIPLVLGRQQPERPPPERPQEPRPPYPYRAAEVFFRNQQDSITLAGTLTWPAGEGPFPAVVLLSGSGPQNRDEEVFGHKPFLVLADYLTRQGFAVLRYDDRGTAASEGDFDRAVLPDFARDAAAAVDYLRSRPEIDAARIGLLGHSEGGLVAPLVATTRTDIAFVVLLAAPGLPGHRLLLSQQEAIARKSGISETVWQRMKAFNEGAIGLVADDGDTTGLAARLHEYFITQLDQNPGLNLSGLPAEEFVAVQIDQLTRPWMVCFIRHDPAPVLRQVRCPVLALNGELDVQVPAGANLAAIAAALEQGGNREVTVTALPGLNHLFQHATTGLPDEYSRITETIAPEVLDIIAAWLKRYTKE